MRLINPVMDRTCIEIEPVFCSIFSIIMPFLVSSFCLAASRFVSNDHIIGVCVVLQCMEYLKVNNFCAGCDTRVDVATKKVFS